MNADQIGRVQELTARINDIRQTLQAIDSGASIVAMILQGIEGLTPSGAGPEVRVSTVGIAYPPMMLDSIKQQQLQFWQQAYDELAGMGVTNVAPPGTP